MSKEHKVRLLKTGILFRVYRPLDFSMWRYTQPGFALRLLCELQKQQQCSLHCDALLQTEGISIPAHSCVLSALSPVFCRAFSSAPSIPVGQSRLIQLEAVGTDALMKLVGFMYSGELEGESLEEQEEVIDIAYRLGFSNFINQRNRHPETTASWREIGLQTEDTGGRTDGADVQILFKKPRVSHSGTQTDSTESRFADTCVASEPELSTGLPDELADVPNEYNSISPDAGLAWIEEIVARTPSNSSKALVGAHARHGPNQKKNRRARNIKKHAGTKISLKIKLKRQRSGDLWKVVSVQEESTVDESQPRGSSYNLPVTHSLAQHHESSVKVQLSRSPSLTCRNLETVALTPPSELTTPLPSRPIRPQLKELFHPSSILQMQPLSSDWSHPGESDEHIAKLLEMVAVGLNITPSGTMEESSSISEHLVERCTSGANSPASCLCFLGRTPGAMENGTLDLLEPREAGSGDQSGCRKPSDLEDAASGASNPPLFSNTSPCMTQKNTIDSSFTPPGPMAFSINFGRNDLEHQTINELKTFSNNVIWGSDTSAQSGMQSVENGSKDCEIQTAAVNDPKPVEGQFPGQIDVADPVSVCQLSDDSQAIHNENSTDFSEMRLPVCLSPLASEADETTAISTRESLRRLELSSCLSASHGELQPALRLMSSPSQPQALPVKTTRQKLSCTSHYVNEFRCSVEKKNSYLLRSKRDLNGDTDECKSKGKKTKDLDNYVLKGKEDNVLDRHISIREVSPAARCLQADSEPCRKKAKMTGYPNAVYTAEKLIPCSVRITPLRHNKNIKDISNPVISDTANYRHAAEALKSLSRDQKSENQRQAFKCKGHDERKKDALHPKQPASNREPYAGPHRETTSAKALMDNCSKKSELDTSSSSSQYDSTQKIMGCVPTDEIAKQTNVQCHPLVVAQPLSDLLSEGESNLPAPDTQTSTVEPEKGTPAEKLNSEGNKRKKIYASPPKKVGFCDKIFHHAVSIVGTSVNQPKNHQLRSNLQTTDKEIGTSLPPSLISKKMREHPETEHGNVGIAMDGNENGKKYTTEERGIERSASTTEEPHDVLIKRKGNRRNAENGEQIEASSEHGNECLTNGNFSRPSEISTNAGLSIYDPHMCTIPPVRDFNNNLGMENHLQLTSATLGHPSIAGNMAEKAKTDEEMTESLCEVSTANKQTEVKLTKAKELHPEGIGSTGIRNPERQEVWKKETEKTEHGYISKMHEYNAGIGGTTADVLDEHAQIAAGHGDELINVEGDTDDGDEEESRISIVVDNDGQLLAYEEELSRQQVLRNEAEVLTTEEATVGMMSEMINTKEISSSRQEPDPISSSVDTSDSSAAFLPDLNIKSAEEHSSAEEELVVDDTCDSPVQPCDVVCTQCNVVPEEEDGWREDEEEEEEEEVDVTGEESN